LTLSFDPLFKTIDLRNGLSLSIKTLANISSEFMLSSINSLSFLFSAVKKLFNAIISSVFSILINSF
jgi:hypothetical protein